MSSTNREIPIISPYVDTHFHLLHSRRKGLEPKEILREAFSSGMAFGLDISTGLDKLEQRLSLGEDFPNLFFSIGCYPSYAENPLPSNLEETLIEQAEISPRIIALGEIGLDYHWDYGTRNAQKELLQRQVAIANSLNLPVLIHCRDAQADLLEIFTAAPPVRPGVIHCFSGDYEFAHGCLDAGFYLSFAGNVTYKNAKEIQDVARRIPLNRILVETDAPYLAPVPMRGKTNRPEFVRFTHAFVSELRGITNTVLSEAVCTNTSAVFNVPV